MTNGDFKLEEPTVVPVLLAGGNGSRLWPLSRKQYPKQFLPLIGENTLLQDAVRLAMDIPHATRPIVLGSQEHRFLIEDQLDKIGIEATVILEPEGRDTAPAAAVVSHYIATHYGPEAVILMMPSDHHIGDAESFYFTASAGVAAAVAGEIVTFGITPSRPETGYGYMRAGEPAVTALALKVDEFVEKPDRQRAEEFAANPRYFWNSGIFMFQADLGRRLFEEFEPETAAASYAALQQASIQDGHVCLAADEFALCRKLSFDYAIMERTRNAVLVPLDAEWDDVGAWTYLERQPQTDAYGNRVSGDVLTEEAKDNLLVANSRLLAVSGVQNLIVIETDDAVLVTSRDKAQNVKAVYQRLSEAGREEVEHRSRVYRPWGYYETVAQGHRFQSKRIMVNPGCRLSLQMHHHRAEHWVVVRGTAIVTREDERFMLSENQSTFIPIGARHRLENPGVVPLELIEVQSGPYLGEDDIVRFDDAYGRDVATEEDYLPARHAEEVDSAA